MTLEDFGMMTEPMPENRVQYDLRALDKYCSERKILPIDTQRMYINTSGARWLVEKYYGGVDL